MARTHTRVTRPRWPPDSRHHLGLLWVEPGYSIQPPSRPLHPDRARHASPASAVPKTNLEFESVRSMSITLTDIIGAQTRVHFASRPGPASQPHHTARRGPSTHPAALPDPGPHLARHGLHPAAPRRRRARIRLAGRGRGRPRHPRRPRPAQPDRAHPGAPGHLRHRRRAGRPPPSPSSPAPRNPKRTATAPAPPP